MITHRRTVSTLLCVLSVNLHLTTAFAQGSAFTYQGVLHQSGHPYTGNAEMQFTLWDAATAGSAVGTNSTGSVIVGVTNGLFTTSLDFGASAFPGAERWLQVEVRTVVGPFTTLSPRQKLTATPYALVAGSVTGIISASQLTGTLPSANLEGTYSGALAFNNAANSFNGSGSGLANLNASQLTSGTVPNARLSSTVSLLGQSIESAEITDGTVLAIDLDAASFNATFWKTDGNSGTSAGNHFVGTTDNQPLEFKVNNLRALRLEDNGDSASDGNTSPDGAPNVIGGAPYNFVGAGVVGATISGGGATSYAGFSNTNSVLADFGTIGGGFQNTIAAGAFAGTIAGGYHNDLDTTAYYSTIGGGYNNYIADNARYATIGGGYLNDLGTAALYSTIGGGSDNNIAASAQRATIAGGGLNDIGTSASYSTIGGGRDNNIAADSWYATIAGGANNDIGTNAPYSTIGGGWDNNIVANVQYATIAGGYFNDISTNAHYSTIGGGYDNNIAAHALNATIAGGYGNNMRTNADYSTIGGGSFNTIATNGIYATIPGGYLNAATNYAFAAGHRAKANHTGAFVWGDSTNTDIASTNANSVTMRAVGGYRLFSGTSAGVHLAAGSGSWTSMSDRNMKEEFAPVDSRAVLEKVAALPITTWKYKSQDASVRHIGPTAQDFKVAFGLGDSETGITSVDADGVALAAIQGLNQKLEEKSREIQELKNTVAELKRLVTSLAESPRP
jgi:trimeric autotransporter adhesin